MWIESELRLLETPAGPRLAISYDDRLTPTGISVMNGQVHLCCLEGVFTSDPGPELIRNLARMASDPDARITMIALDEDGSPIRSSRLPISD